MKNSASFWALVTSAIIGFVVGSFTHWIIGWIIFFLVAAKAVLYGLVMDTISGLLKYHHDRIDERTKKQYESEAYLEYLSEQVRQKHNADSHHLINKRGRYG